MRWYKKKEPEAGDYRTIETFLLLPREIGDEGRWLEKAKIVQRFGLFNWYDYSWGD